MFRTISVLASASLLVACAPPAATSPAQAEARAGAAYEHAARNCGGMAGGFNDVVAMRNQAAIRYANAKKLGATDALIEQEKQTVASSVGNAELWVGKADTCQHMIAEAAMNAR